MNPSNQKCAGRQAANMIWNRVTGVSYETKRRRAERAALLAQMIWQRWQVGIYRWQLKHVRWVMIHGIEDYSRHTKYQYWLCLRDLLAFLRQSNWLVALVGPWQRPGM